ncbi:MAG: flagella basal body P-ring formation protein FlgA [Robiginitomaculum sp.]|nr:MAG: flagella basal body P-ring formation protein FlgA [Robiginitomaculum sp.]
MHNYFASLDFRRRFGIFALAILLLVVSASLVLAQSATGTVEENLQLRSVIVVKSENVTFADLFINAGDLGDVVVTAAPLPGRSKALHPIALSRQAKARGATWNNVAGLRRIVIKRAGRRLGRHELIEILREEMDRSGNGQRFELALTAGSTGIFVPDMAENLPFIEHFEMNIARRSFVASLVPYGGAQAVPLRGRAWQMSEIPTLNRAFVSGEIIERDDIRWQFVRTDRLGNNPVLLEDDLIGKEVRRSLIPAKALRQHDLKTPDVVKKGELISIAYELPGLRLTARGKVLSNAALGDTVRAVNLQSSRTIEILITGPGKAVAVPTQMLGG